MGQYLGPSVTVMLLTDEKLRTIIAVRGRRMSEHRSCIRTRRNLVLLRKGNSMDDVIALFETSANDFRILSIVW